ncbi:hypothetical protein HOU02_gp288 [Caulobacter phage CcrBL9]|uniref:Uncharacterized protein n=1 Tax=Caulobacter phage CcrBL9 TaxID=2283270 RepID=A0A385EF71_9CAUD|nr:hypothetical protein HOU02_gp288 [Caulobacter phage CcrBL9]AXQ69437.1 hypothetical protein CcrBL9_gp413 [Caulobacter phage CcrBL9]
MTKKLTPYERIVEAGRKGVGVRLSVEECQALMLDDAIAQAAYMAQMQRSGKYDWDDDGHNWTPL